MQQGAKFLDALAGVGCGEKQRSVHQ